MKPRSEFRKQVAASVRRLEAQGMPRQQLTGPSMRRERTPGCVLYRVSIRKDGRRIDAKEAAQDFAKRPWAKKARYLGSSCGYHVFERPDGPR